MYLQPRNVSVNRSSKDEAFNKVDLEAFKLHQDESKILSMIELLQEPSKDLHLFEEKEIKSNFVSHDAIIQ